MARNKSDESDDSIEEFENEPSSLDELSHAEMIALYRESTDTMRFAKHLQWWTVGSTLLVFGGLIGIAKLVSADRGYTDLLTWIVILLTMSVIFTLIVYQFWQHTESLKINEVSKHMSSLFTHVRKIKSYREANIHRYLLLTFMVLTLILGAIVTRYGLVQMLAMQRY